MKTKTNNKTKIDVGLGPLSRNIAGGLCAIGAILLPRAAADSPSTMIGDEVTISTFADPRGRTVEVVEPGVEFEVSGGGERDLVDISQNTILAKVIPSAAWQFGGAAGGDMFRITGIDNALDPENSVIDDVRFVGLTTYQGVTAKNLTFTDARGVDSGTVSFEIEGVWNPFFVTDEIFPRWTVEVTFRRLPPVVILSSEVDLEQNSVSVTWASVAGNSYDVSFSTNMDEWETVIRGHRADRARTTLGFSIPVGGERRGFFRVEEVSEE